MAPLDAVSPDDARAPTETLSTSCPKTEDVIKSFNTRAFKREQPSNIDLLWSFVARVICRQDPLSFVAYWGKGPRDDIAEPDRQCVSDLQQMVSQIDAVHAPGTELRLVLTDSHAKLNSHKARSINRYFKAIEAAARRNGFSTWRLEALTDAMRPALRMISYTDREHPKQLPAELEKSAAKWYRGRQPIDVGAQCYFDLNMVERRVIDRVFSSSIFITFNSSHMRIPFPDRLPVFYVYSMKKNVGLKPWFQ